MSDVNTFYISDLDGTLLQNDDTLSTFSETVLRDLLNDGLAFTVASARSVVSMQTMLWGLPLRLPVIEFNGAFLSNLATGRHEVVNSLEPSFAESIYKQVIEYRLVPFMSTFNGTEDCVHYNAILNDGMRWYLNDRLQHNDPRWHFSDDLAFSLTEQVICLTMIGGMPALAELQEAILAEHSGAVETYLFENRYSPPWHWLTVHDRRATKDQAIRALMEDYGLKGSEIVVFGDQGNDLKMFQMADRAVAVANATEEVKRHADVMIGSNDDDSVVKFIQEDWVSRAKNAAEIS